MKKDFKSPQRELQAQKMPAEWKTQDKYRIIFNHIFGIFIAANLPGMDMLSFG